VSKAKNKIRLLESLDVFQSLSTEQLEVIGKLAKWKSFSKGQAVYTNEAGDSRGSGRIYAVHEGEVLITKSGDAQRDITLANFVAGESFGELSLFDRETVDTSAHCESDTTLLVLPAEDDPHQAVDRVDRLFRDHPQIKATILFNLLAMVARRIRSSNKLIAEKSPWVQELRRQVMRDKLTSLYNAGYLEEELPRLLEQKADDTCFLMIKPDNLKNLNDHYGHQAGDRTLQLMAEELRRQLGKRGIAIRFKGDVFSVILPQAGSTAAEQIAEQIREGMSKIDVSEVSRDSAEPRSDLRITVSLGIAVVPSGGIQADTLIDQAYQNMFSARNGGGNRVCSGEGS
jgi:diguanylate cyclase (GGDEF)-like protein